MNHGHHDPSINPRRDLLSLKEFYDVYRDYMKHEDDLLNQRSTWHLLFQGFLFATLGVIGEWHAEAGYPDSLHTERLYLPYALAVTGILVAAAAFLSIRAANNAIESLCSKWTAVSSFNYDEDIRERLPQLAGGGHETAKFWGKTPAVAIPLVVIAAWLGILGMVYLDIRADPRQPQSSVTTQSAAIGADNHRCGEPLPPGSPPLTQQQLIQEIGCSRDNADRLNQQLLNEFGLKLVLIHVPKHPPAQKK